MIEPAPTRIERDRHEHTNSLVLASGIVAYVALAVAGLAIGSATGAGSIVDGWVLFAFLWAALIGLLIMRRHPGHPIGRILYASAFLYGLTYLSQQYAVHSALAPTPLPGGMVAAWLGFWAVLPVIALMGFFLPLLFPDGKLASSRWRPIAWSAAALTVAGVLYAMLSPASHARAGYPTIRNPTGILPMSDWLELMGIALNLLFLLVALVSVASVFERAGRADREERLQIKWFSYAAVLVFLSFVVGVLSEAFRDLEALDEAVSAIAVTALPTAVGIAVLRYRLYEIDPLINRTVLYGALTGILAGVYTASIALFQRVFVATTGQSSDLAIVMAIFVLATVFTPIRTRLQTGVDRYFRTGASGPAPSLTVALDDLERLAQLHSRGVLTDEEFAAKKSQVLGV